MQRSVGYSRSIPEYTAMARGPILLTSLECRKQTVTAAWKLGVVGNVSRGCKINVHSNLGAFTMPSFEGELSQALILSLVTWRLYCLCTVRLMYDTSMVGYTFGLEQVRCMPACLHGSQNVDTEQLLAHSTLLAVSLRCVPTLLRPSNCTWILRPIRCIGACPGQGGWLRYFLACGQRLRASTLRHALVLAFSTCTARHRRRHAVRSPKDTHPPPRHEAPPVGHRRAQAQSRKHCCTTARDPSHRQMAGHHHQRRRPPPAAACRTPWPRTRSWSSSPLMRSARTQGPRTRCTLKSPSGCWSCRSCGAGRACWTLRAVSARGQQSAVGSRRMRRA